MLQLKTRFMSLRLIAILLVVGTFSTTSLTAQPILDLELSTNATLLKSVDSLLTSIEVMKVERAQLKTEFSRLNTRIQSLERSLQRKVDNLASRQQTLLVGIDTLQVMMPSEEPIKATNMSVIYLSQRQDSLVAYIERLENRIVSLPDKHYWGVRNGFKQFDHLLLFTFLGALTSLGVVLLVKGGSQKIDETIDLVTYHEQEADRLSITITLLVGSILVILFILFIL